MCQVWSLINMMLQLLNKVVRHQILDVTNYQVLASLRLS